MPLSSARADGIIGEDGKVHYPLNPIFEGLYAIRLTCKNPKTDCHADQLKSVNRLSVVDSRLNTRVWLTFASTHHHDLVDRYMEAEINERGNHLVATPSSRSGTAGRFSYVELDFDEATGEFQGTVVAPDSLSDYHIYGKPIETADQFTNHKPPRVLAASEVVGVYQGRLGTLPGHLTIKQLPDQHMVAHFQTLDKAKGDVPLLRMDFSSGEWEPEQGVLFLTFNLPRLSGQGLMAMAFRSIRGNSILLSGFEIAGAADNKVVFSKIR